MFRARFFVWNDTWVGRYHFRTEQQARAYGRRTCPNDELAEELAKHGRADMFVVEKVPAEEE